MPNNRDDFSAKTKLQIAKRAGWLCSDPECRRPTIGATSDGQGEILEGMACHITAASPGGPRYDASMSADERRSAQNGLWMCKLHGASVDAPDPKFTVDLLRAWKAQAEQESHRRVLYNDVAPAPRAAPTDLAGRLLQAAKEDLAALRRSARWPTTDVALTVEMKSEDKPFSTTVLAQALSTLGDLILVAPPGTGKTSTLLQVGEHLIGQGDVAIYFALADWATENATLLESVLRRAAFQSKISDADFRAVAAKPGVHLLLDGWNELDTAARRRATAQLKRLQIELPELGLFIATRKQALDVPFEGVRLDLQPLSETEQLAIARAMRGAAGERLLDIAWRTSGVRELVSVPLYLRALMALPEGQAIPTTREEVLRWFVLAHEGTTERAEALTALMHGRHGAFLSGLAVAATRAATTSLSDADARRSITATADRLVTDGQLGAKPEPAAILESLTAHHVLVRDGQAFSFQHHQFQEWYAADAVERAMLEGASAHAALKTDIFNAWDWEEAILFAVERMARGDVQSQKACANAIVAAFEVDPILAADMIFRATDAVWAEIAATIETRVRQWHAPAKVDRALRFMITSGRSEFIDLIWPLVTAENDQKSLPALRAARRFRPSVLGPDPRVRINALPAPVRLTMLREIAARSGIDGLDLAAAIAKDDPEPDVKTAVVDALSFRRADRHVAAVLESANAATFDLVHRKGLLNGIGDEHVRQGLAEAAAREAKGPVSDLTKLRRLIYGRDGGKDRDADIAKFVASMEIDRKELSNSTLIYDIQKTNPKPVAEGLLERVRKGRDLFFGADDMLAASGIVADDDQLVAIALDDSGRRDDRADAAASVLGSTGVGQAIDAMLKIAGQTRELKRYNEALSNRYHALRDRIGHAPGGSLVAALEARAAASPAEIYELANLVSRREEDGARARPFDANARVALAALARQWAERLIAAGDSANRAHLAAVADMIGHIPDPSLLPSLKLLADDEMRRYRAFRQAAEAAQWRSCDATNEARMLYTNRYQQAFTAIASPETTALMVNYLSDRHFGETAALVLKVQWLNTNEPRDPDQRRLGRIDFSRVEAKRAERAMHPEQSSPEADAIFAAIDTLIADTASDAEKKLGVLLAIQAVRLPHGERSDIVKKLMALAPQAARASLALNLVLSGTTLAFDDVKTGIDQVFEDAKKQSWILTDGGWQLKAWLLLLPFTDQPGKLAEIVQELPPRQREPDFVEEMVAACEAVASPEVETALFALADFDPRFHGHHAWRRAVLRRGTLTSATQYLDRAIAGQLKAGDYDTWYTAQEISGLLAQHPMLRARTYEAVKTATGKRFDLLIQAIGEEADEDGLLALVELENALKRPLISWRTVQGAITEHVPSEHWKGAFDVVPVAATTLRTKLLALTKDGGADDAAARVLTKIDKVRDDYGSPAEEPRHPDLASGRPWPILTPDPNADDGV